MTCRLKVFDCIIHDLLIAKLPPCGFDNDSLNFICNYLLGRGQRIKISSSFSTWSNIEYGAPQGFILGALLFNINTLDVIFEEKDINFAAYTDDNTSYVCDENLEVLLSKLQICALKLPELFSDNYMKMNFGECHLILRSNDENKKRELNGEVINNTEIQKLLGAHIEYKLKLDTYIKTLCKKVGKKLHALARFIKYMSTIQAQMLMKS